MTKMTRVVPAILTEDPGALEKMIRQAEGFTDYVQVDVMDGQFVPSRSIGHRDVAAVSPELAWEAHLMVQHPEDYVEGFHDAGARRIIFHYEATASPEKVISLIRERGLQVGLALNPKTKVAEVLPLVGKLDSVLFLTVDPGFYGSPFIPEVLNEVAELIDAGTGIEIGVDGGIKEGNISDVARLGVDSVCVGSAIFLQPEPAESYRHLTSLAKEATKKRQ